MKTIKISLLIIVLIFTFTSCADLTNESNNPTESTEVSKQESSLVPSVILLREVITTGSFVTNKTVYEYDEQNREISKKNCVNNKISSTIITKYDESGFKNYTKHSNATNSDYTEESWSNSPTGKVLTLERKNFSFGKLYQSTLTYTYDEKDRMITMVNKDDNNNTIYEDETYEYIDEYDSHKLTRILNGVKKVSIRIYNAAGKIVETQSLNEDGTISSRSITEYDEKNNIIKDISGDVITTFVYEYEGEQIKIQSIYNSKDELSTSYEFTYNEAGDIIKQEDFDASGTRTGVTEYIYR